MFQPLRRLVRYPSRLFALRPLEILALVEIVWNQRINDSRFDLGHPLRRSGIDGLDDRLLDQLLLSSDAQKAAGRIRQRERIWDHVIYAYMIENTRIYEIFRRVLQELLHGEKLGVPSRESQQWMRITEELLYRSAPGFSIGALASDIRPDLSSTRRNVYQRMFGMELSHSPEGGRTAPSVGVANDEFVGTFEEFLHEVWVGMANVNNQIGERPTDDQAIANLAEKLRDMLISRRLNGNLSREEFLAVVMMSWFHLTVELNEPVPIIEDLKSQGASAEQRLFKIAECVGLPAHPLSKSYFEIADPLSTILILIETDHFADRNVVPFLYTPGDPCERDMRRIISHWSIITGRHVKTRRMTEGRYATRVGSDAWR